MEMRTKGVTFNLRDPFQKEMFDYSTSRTNFSGYVKHLITRDMLGVAPPQKAHREAKKANMDDVSTLI